MLIFTQLAYHCIKILFSLTCYYFGVYFVCKTELNLMGMYLKYVLKIDPDLNWTFSLKMAFLKQNKSFISKLLMQGTYFSKKGKSNRFITSF